MVLSLLWIAGSVANSQEQRPLQVSLTPATIRSGDAVRLAIRDPDRREHLTVTALGQDVHLEYEPALREWFGLIGVDLDVKPGEYPIAIDRSVFAPATTHPLRVSPRQFRVRRLKVSPQFVDPPPETLEQIARDARLLADTYARSSTRQWLGAFVLPVDAKPSSNFGTRSYYNGEARAPHAGVDFAAGTGTLIRAANFGTVAVAEPLYFTGNTVVIDHGDRLFSVFAHLSEFMVKQGDDVDPKTFVGRVGNTGRVTGPHLHWSVRLNGARVDPLSLIAATKISPRK
jgi:murein DD-endopeptidase MepM/ murein hydrolase activator NlpD